MSQDDLYSCTFPAHRENVSLRLKYMNPTLCSSEILMILLITIPCNYITQSAFDIW